MAGLDSKLFARWEDVPDDTKLVFEAKARLGFSCEFAALNLNEMQTVLALARTLKAYLMHLTPQGMN